MMLNFVSLNAIENVMKVSEIIRKIFEFLMSFLGKKINNLSMNLTNISSAELIL